LKRTLFTSCLMFVFVCILSLCVHSQTIEKSKPSNDLSISDSNIKAVTLNGKLLSTDIKLVNGRYYVSVADLAKTLGLTLQIDTQTETLMLSGETAIGADGKEAVAAIDALQALEALHSVVSSGVSYRDYGTRKADAKIIVDRFLNEYKQHPAVDAIKEAMAHYDAAGVFWQMYFDDYGDYFLPLSDSQVARYAKIYPEIEAKREYIGGRKLISLTTALNIIWNKASESIDKARSILK
jgi:hypothetical protein